MSGDPEWLARARKATGLPEGETVKFTEANPLFDARKLAPYVISDEMLTDQPPSHADLVDGLRRRLTVSDMLTDPERIKRRLQSLQSEQGTVAALFPAPPPLPWPQRTWRRCVRAQQRVREGLAIRIAPWLAETDEDSSW